MKPVHGFGSQRHAVVLSPTHPFAGTDGGVYSHGAVRLRIVRRATRWQLEQILQTPGLQGTVRRAAEARLARLTLMRSARPTMAADVNRTGHEPRTTNHEP